MHRGNCFSSLGPMGLVSMLLCPYLSRCRFKNTAVHLLSNQKRGKSPPSQLIRFKKELNASEKKNMMRSLHMDQVFQNLHIVIGQLTAFIQMPLKKAVVLPLCLAAMLMSSQFRKSCFGLANGNFSLLVKQSREGGLGKWPAFQFGHKKKRSSWQIAHTAPLTMTSIAQAGGTGNLVYSPALRVEGCAKEHNGLYYAHPYHCQYISCREFLNASKTLQNSLNCRTKAISLYTMDNDSFARPL